MWIPNTEFEQPTANSFPVIGSNHNGGHLFFDTDGLVGSYCCWRQPSTGNGHVSIGNGADATNILVHLSA